MARMTALVGIDLGTTHMCMYKEYAIQLKHGKTVLPTTVSITNGEWKVGRHKITDDHGASTFIHSVKRVLGRDGDPELERDIAELKLPFVLKDGQAGCFVDNKFIPAQEIAVIILMYAKDRYAGVDSQTTEPPCVLTVPAYFTARQTQCLKDAARAAGWRPLKTVTEPIAVAVSEYSTDDEVRRPSLFIDCGGGTLDCSVVKLYVEDGMKFYHVLSTSGDNTLGGIDFLEAMAKVIRPKFPNTPDHQVLSACENAMHCWEHTNESLTIALNGASYNLPVSDFREACRPLLLRIEDTIHRLRFLPQDIYLSGGATRNPLFGEVIRMYFAERHKGRTPIFHNLDSRGDEVVARGAGIIATREDLTIVDVLPRDLGIEADNGSMAVILPRNTPIPISRQRTFWAVDSGDTRIVLLEGNKAKASENYLVDEFCIDAPAGAEIEVTIWVDGLTCHVTAKGAQGQGEMVVERVSALGDKEIGEMRDRARARLGPSNHTRDRENDGEAQTRQTRKSGRVRKPSVL